MVKRNFRGPLQFMLGVGLAFLFFYMLAPFLLPLILGAIVALLSYPIYASLKKKLPRGLSGLITTLAIVIGFMLPLTLVTYNSVYQAAETISRIKIPTEENSIQKLLEHPKVAFLVDKVSYWFPIDEAWLKAQTIDIAQAVIEKLSAVIGHSLAGIPSIAFGFFMVFLSVYFFLVDGERFMRFLATLSPMSRERSHELFSVFERTCRGVVLGLFASGFVQSILMTIMLLATRVPNAAFFGFATFLVSMVPLFGSTPVTAGAVIYLLVEGRPGAATAMLIGGILIGLSDNIVRPWIMKGSAEMHPLLALVSVFGAMSFLGAAGIFLGPVIAAVFVSFLRIYSQENAKEARA